MIEKLHLGMGRGKLKKLSRPNAQLHTYTIVLKGLFDKNGTYP